MQVAPGPWRSSCLHNEIDVPDTPINSAAAKLVADAVVCDMVLPWGARWISVRGNTLERFAKSGFSYVSLTVGLDSVPSLEATIQHMAAERRRIDSAPDKYVFVETVDDILRAKKEGKLALGFHHQGTNACRATSTWRRCTTSSACARC